MDIWLKAYINYADFYLGGRNIFIRRETFVCLAPPPPKIESAADEKNPGNASWNKEEVVQRERGAKISYYTK